MSADGHQHHTVPAGARTLGLLGHQDHDGIGGHQLGSGIGFGARSEHVDHVTGADQIQHCAIGKGQRHNPGVGPGSR